MKNIDNMTDDEKRVNIAEACGWKPFTGDRSLYHGHIQNQPLWTKKGQLVEGNWEIHQLHDLPDYLNDLNACHEAEKTLPALDKIWSSSPSGYPSLMYAHALSKIVGVELREISTISGLKGADDKEVVLNTFVDAGPFESWKLIHATARHRADAFLMTLP